MLGQGNYIDLTGQMEDVFDSKIQQINFLTEENVKDKIEEAVAEIQIKPEIFDDIYAKIDHTHMNFDDIVVQSMKTNNGIFQINTGTNYNGYAVLSTNHDSGGSIYIRQFDTKGTQRNSLTLLDNNGNMYAPKNSSTYTLTVRNDADIAGNLTVGGLKIIPDGNSYASCYVNGEQFWGCNSNSDVMGVYKPLIITQNLRTEANMIVDKDITIGGNTNITGDLYVNGVKIDGSGGGGTITEINNDLTINGDIIANKNLRFGSLALKNNSGRLNLNKGIEILDETGVDTKLLLGNAKSSKQCIVMTYSNNNGEVPEFKLGFWDNKGDDIVINTNKELTINNTTKITGDLYVNGVKIDGSGGGGTITEINNDLTINGVLSLNGTFYVNSGIETPNLYLTSDGRAPLELYHEDGRLMIYDQKTAKTHTLYDINETITHQTDKITEPFEIGTFCETNGGIYTGYDKIDTTDCICQVQQSNTLNPRIVGIITSPNQFASHGDVLVKIVPGTYHLGDILCPDITGKARKATDTELQYMMLHAIPRPKITSLDTKIEGTVACFIV